MCLSVIAPQDARKYYRELDSYGVGSIYVSTAFLARMSIHLRRIYLAAFKWS